VAAGKSSKSDSDLDAITLIDLPGRRSHEYFPELSSDGKWLVWAATQRGHDHDIADYEIYLWEVGTPADTAARLTYHSGNDRWPDIFIGPAPAAAQTRAPAAGPAKDKGAVKEDDHAKAAPSSDENSAPSKQPAKGKTNHR
jgi:hypothetical protein